MVGARNLLRRHYDSYGGCSSDTTTTYTDFHQLKSSMRHTLMAEEISRSGGGGGGGGGGGDEEEEEEVGTSSKDGGEDEAWLQLSIGGQSSSDSPAKTQGDGNGSRGRGRVMELQLFSDRPSGHLRSVPPSTVRTMGDTGIGVARGGAMMMPVLPASAVRPWGFFGPNPMLPSSSTTPPRYDFRSYICPPWSLGSPAALAGSSGSSGLRIVSPPRRRQAGVWFMLVAAQNQEREPFLPQIPRNYLRIRDERMTVRMVLKYLVNKLGLEDESEHVRDHIWCSPEITAAQLEDFPSTAADHVMTLQYSRSNQTTTTTTITTTTTTSLV